MIVELIISRLSSHWKKDLYIMLSGAFLIHFCPFVYTALKFNTESSLIKRRKKTPPSFKCKFEKVAGGNLLV